MNDVELREAIITELGYSDLTALRLVRTLCVGISQLKPELKRMEKEGLIKKVERDDEEVWSLK